MRGVSISGGVGGSTCTLNPWIIYTNLKVPKSLLHLFIEMETFVFRIELLYLSGFFDTFNLLRCCVFVGRILLCGFFFVQKLCAGQFRSQKRRVIQFVVYHEIVQSKVEVQTQCTSGHDRCSFHDFFFCNIVPQIGQGAQYDSKSVSAYVLFLCLLHAWCGNFLWSLPFIALCLETPTTVPYLEALEYSLNIYSFLFLRLFGYVLPSTSKFSK
jgi:hypothetical protein